MTWIILVIAIVVNIIRTSINVYYVHDGMCNTDTPLHSCMHTHTHMHIHTHHNTHTNSHVDPQQHIDMYIHIHIYILYLNNYT